IPGEWNSSTWVKCHEQRVFSEKVASETISHLPCIFPPGVVVDCGHEKDKNQQEKSESQRTENRGAQVQARGEEKAGSEGHDIGEEISEEDHTGGQSQGSRKKGEARGADGAGRQPKRRNHAAAGEIASGARRCRRRRFRRGVDRGRSGFRKRGRIA